MNIFSSRRFHGPSPVSIRLGYRLLQCLLIASAIVLPACRMPSADSSDGTKQGNGSSQKAEDFIGVGITGIDSLPEHLSIQNFWVDGYNAAQAGSGGSLVCCAELPRHWRLGLSVEVRWGVSNWRDRTYYMRKEQVPVERYDEVGHLWVHFLPDGSVQAISSPKYGPPHPLYPGPHVPPTDKDPLHKYYLPENERLSEITPPPAGAPP